MANTARTPTLLWLCAGYWAISGALGLAPFFMVPKFILQARGPILAFVIAAALSHVLALAGAGLLVFRKTLAVPALALVFVVGAGGFLVMGKSPLELNAVTQGFWLFSAVTVAYAFALVRRGVLR